MGKRYQVYIEPNFTTLVIGTIVIEGLGKTLDPNFEFVKQARPYLVKDKQVRNAYIRGQLAAATKTDKSLLDKMAEWWDLFKPF
jgi:predicted unusual protein kinase regulating ubiquinone biosynthesis (AarF/ABC1/UbiB family)